MALNLADYREAMNAMAVPRDDGTGLRDAVKRRGTAHFQLLFSFILRHTAPPQRNLLL